MAGQPLVSLMIRPCGGGGLRFGLVGRHLRLLWESTESLELWAPMELCYLGPVSEKVASRWFREDGTLAISGKSMCFFFKSWPEKMVFT